MKTTPAYDSETCQEEIAALELALREKQQRLQVLTGGHANGASQPSGESRRLQEAHEKLIESEERFRSLFAASATGIAVTTTQGIYIQANPAYCRMLGYTEDELSVLNFASLTYPEDLILNLKLRDEILSGQRKSFFVEERYLKKNGDILWVRLSVSATHTPGGEIAALVMVAEDITERRLAEVALGQSEERLRLITDLVPHGIFAKDAEGRHIFANPALAELAGLSIQEIAGKTDFDLVPDRAQAEAYRADDLAVIRSGDKMVISEEPRTDLSGRTRLLQTIKVPFRLAETGEMGVLGLCVDITERKRMEARFRRLIDSNVVGVMFWNRNGNIIEANDAFLAIVGYNREDLAAGRIKWTYLTPPEHADRDNRAFQQIAATGLCEPYEKEYIRLDGAHVPILIGGTIFEDNPEEGVCFVLDLTERKKLEQQLLRAQRMESLGMLAGGIAHDLNNILTPILLSLEVLKSITVDPGSLKILETIGVSANRGADIVREVLCFTRGGGGQRSEIQPKQLFQDLEKIIKETFPKNILLRFCIPNDAWTFMGDATQMHQILLNLCVNARDAMPDGGSLTISAENSVLDEWYAATNIQAKPGRYVHIRATDSGMGIPQSIIDKIFDPFFTTKGPNKGTGLGLSSVMSIVKSHDGIINVYSDPGKGTTFNVYLPAMEDSRQTEQKQIEDINLPLGNGETILLVDDEPAILTIARLTLETFGYRALTAQNGEEAIAMYEARKHEIAVVLTDMMMPIMDGASLIRSLLRINPAIKIVRASGLSLNDRENGLPEAIAKRLLAKPYTAETLLKAMRSVLQEK